jgi:adenine-specific DNA-methyltransferase
MGCDLIAGYTSGVEITHRQEFGQYFTEPAVARFMAKWVVAGGAQTIFDPAFGLGAFYEATNACAFAGQFAGMEQDPIVFEYFMAHAKTQNLQIKNEDYFDNWGLRHEAVLCNPPYQRFQKFYGREKVVFAFQKKFGIKLSGYTNIASVFLIKSIHELAENGRLAYIMPLEFVNAGYGKIIKQIILDSGHLHSIIKLDCEKEVFPDATTSVGILLFEKKDNDSPINFYNIKNIKDLDTLFQSTPNSVASRHELSANEKWIRHFSVNAEKIEHDMLFPLGNYGKFSRGIATGANEFFVLNRAQLEEKQLSLSEVAPCITKSAQIKTPVFNHGNLEQLAQNNSAVYLFNVMEPLSRSASAYVASGEALGFQKRYLTKGRKPWFKNESRQPSPLLFGVFSRDGFKVIRNHTQALNLTCYHGFIPNCLGQKYIDHIFLFLLSQAGRKILSENMRQYGRALDKFEPNDLNQAQCPGPEWMAKLPDTLVQAELKRLEAGEKLSDQIEAQFNTLLA